MKEIIDNGTDQYRIEIYDKKGNLRGSSVDVKLPRNFSLQYDGGGAIHFYKDTPIEKKR